MTADRIVHIFAGAMIVITLALGVTASPFYVSSYILWITLFFGANLFQSGITKFCPLEIVLKKTGICQS